LKERQYWDDYMQAYEDVFRRCSRKLAPWYIIPSNQKWYRNVAISQILIDALEGLKMKFPKPQFDVSKMKVE
jgi:polyphosphate kinase 2 (PPK2 family)